VQGRFVLTQAASDERQEGAASRRLGARWTVDCESSSVVTEVAAITHGEGADAIVEVDAAANAPRYGSLLKWLAMSGELGSDRGAKVEGDGRPCRT